ncbi:Transcriptional activator protein acu-15 [Apiospora arundinis]|uniref:Transcriptional activator protein acu-15 n=1 Tax=Apiospora arundinis TaxID=335852 RepID=A0ABR2J430_9PEZI
MGDDPSEPAEKVLKRKRITQACNSCRAKKSKCDGKAPVCGRCAGYSYHCTWGDQAQQNPATPPALQHLSPSASGMERFREVRAVYDQLVQSVCLQIPKESRARVLNCLAIVQARVESLAQGESADADAGAGDGAGASTATSHTGTGTPGQSPRYLGEISDVHFCHVVTQIAKLGDGGDAVGDIDNYDPDHLPDRCPPPTMLHDLPEPAEMDGELQTYFSTIHFAYPFVSKASFSSRLEPLRAEGDPSGVAPSWLSLFYSILAIGAYYNSFRQDQKPAEIPHQRLFQQSLAWYEYESQERSVTQIAALLAQCFYLLATSQIERCWVSLGLAIRLGQSIGLHTSMERHSRSGAAAVADDGTPADSFEMRSRLWYCMYVLDRLLALQLGRPAAISDHDCHVPIPTRLADLEADDDDDDDEVTPQNTATPLRGASHNKKEGKRDRSQYFACMIEFSSIIGRVLRETYHPRRGITDSLESTRSCDRLLLAWKDKLPRFLRFDAGHVFEKSVTFKRQRNMLAIKFHHLRTLIHRPYLCYPHLSSQKAQLAVVAAVAPDQLARIRAYGATCTLEAQAIIHLLHHVARPADIVIDYPWWQMISCLVCAGSVLVLAGAFFHGGDDDEHLNTTTTYCGTAAALGEDVETCVQVLHELSRHSHGAKLASRMMKNIRARGARISAARLPSIPPLALSDATAVAVTATVARSDKERSEGDHVAPVITGAVGDYGVESGSSNSFGFHVEETTTTPSSFRFDVLEGTLQLGPVDGGGGDVVLDVGLGDAGLWPMVVPDTMNWPDEFLDRS